MPRLVVGVPLFNGEQYAAEALDSLLNQTFRDIGIILVDDGDSQSVRRLGEDLARRDPRVTYERNARRLGMIGNYHRALKLARGIHGDVEYFAWASDHDLWHPRWASRLISELDGDPRAVLAYPLDVGIDEEGEIVRPAWEFDSVSVRRPDQRLTRVVNGMSAGNMVYGIYRREALEACGVYRRVLLPDRLLMTELSLIGTFRQVDEVLWYRRYFADRRPSLDRQRRAFWPTERVPFYARLPWSPIHAALLARSVVFGELRQIGPPHQRAALAAYGASEVISYHVRLALRRRRKRWHLRAKKSVKRLSRAWLDAQRLDGEVDSDKHERPRSVLLGQSAPVLELSHPAPNAARKSELKRAAKKAQLGAEKGSPGQG